MDLLPSSLLNQLPLIAHVAGAANPVLYAKLYLSDDGWHFYLCAIDALGTRVYGYTGPFFDPCAEWQSYGIKALQRKRGWLGCRVTRASSFACCYRSALHPYLLYR